MVGSGDKPPEAGDTFCENMPYCHGIKNDIAMFAFIYKCSTENGRKIILHAEKLVGQATILPIGHRKWAVSSGKIYKLS